MAISNVSALVRLDVMLDYVPVASTVTNLVDLFQKVLVLPFMDKDYVDSSHYFTHLNEKSFARCVLLLVPVIGNLMVMIYDLSTLKVRSDLKRIESLDEVSSTK